MHPYVRAAGYGAVAGLRSMTAPAALAARRGLGRILIASAVAELIADKLPFAPSRIGPQPLGFRIASGAYAGWRVAGRDATPLVAAVVGGLGAIGSAYAGHAARRFAVFTLGIPDLVVAIAEDAIAIGAVLLLRRE